MSITFEKLLYDKKELAAALSISPQTIMSEVGKGKIDGYPHRPPHPVRIG